jgi:hypothetical protein
MIDQRRADKEALFVALQREAATIDEDLAPSSSHLAIQPSTRALCSPVTTGP